MTAADDFESLASFVQGLDTATIVVAASDFQGADYAFRRLSLAQDVADDFRQSVSKATSRLQKGAILKPYDAGYKPDSHEVVYIDLQQEAAVRNIVTAVSNPDSIEIFQEAADFISRLCFYAVVAGSAQNEKAVFFRVYSEKRILGHSRFDLIFADGTYTRVERRIFQFDEDVDCVAWKDTMFITSVGNFQRLFRYFQQLQARAQKTVGTILGRVPISNAEAFQEACTGQIQMLSKLASIARKDYLPTLTMAQVKAVIAEFGRDIQVVVEDGVEKLVFDPSPAKRWEILKLLDDDFLQSSLTNNRYEVNSKSTIA